MQQNTMHTAKQEVLVSVMHSQCRETEFQHCGFGRTAVVMCQTRLSLSPSLTLSL